MEQANDGTEIIERPSDYTALEAISRSEIDIQIATAHRFPRKVAACIDEMKSMATRTEGIAESMMYSLPRAGKVIAGPSVRLAEVVGSSWGNLRYGARVISTDDKFVTAQGVCHDLEKNIAATVDVRRRITDKHGRRFKDDMIVVTSNAVCSIALRQAIFKVVPFAYVKEVYDAAMTVAVGDAESLGMRRDRAIGYFVGTLGVEQDRVLATLHKTSIEEVTIDDLATLTGLKTALKEGDTTIEEVFPAGPDEQHGKVADLNAHINGEQEKQDADKKSKAKSKATAKADAKPEPAPDKPKPDTPDSTAEAEAEPQADGKTPQEYLDAVAAFAEQQKIEPDAANIRLREWCARLFQQTPETMTADQIVNLTSNINRGNVSMTS